MAKKKHLSATSMIDDDVMAPAKSASGPSGAPVTQNLSQTHQRAKDQIDTLQSRLDEERRSRQEEVSELQREIERLKNAGGDPAEVEKAVEQAKRDSQEREKELLGEIEAAKEQVEALEKELEDSADSKVHELDPSRVRRSKFANRNLLSFTDEAFSQLRESVQRYKGNDIPAKVRRVHGDPDHEYEVVYGHRRHHATLLEGTPFFAKVTEISDADLVRLMHVENQREDLSPYEEAFQFKQWLDEGLYKNATSLAADIGESKSFVSQRLAIVDLPKVVFNALKDPRKLGLRSWRDLCSAYRKDAEQLMKNANAMASESDELQLADKSEVDTLYRKLVSREKPVAAKPEVKTISLPSGTPLFKAEKRGTGYSIKFDSKGVAEDIQQEALDELERFLTKRLSK